MLIAKFCFHLRAQIGVILLASFSANAEIDFNRDVRPILSDRCFHCHGPDSKNQKSDLRLDTFDNATVDHAGAIAVIPGDPKGSELIARIESDDPDDLMPPADSKLKLTKEEKAILRQWIEEGGEYDKHWAFKEVVKPPPPSAPAALTEWVRNPIDQFIAARLTSAGQSPNPEAKPEILQRRAALALTGMAPEVGLEGDYESQLDHHLGSIHYAERMAIEWLDAARYADTDGYQNDDERSNWPWRDWVIKAFHNNMPFDQFTIEQLAGDMLPNASNSQKLASAFNRNHRQNSEGGALAEEFFVENVVDRVETTSTVWMGLTMGCCRCHDHKYDPISQKEFFSFYAYFNNIGESGFGKGINANPILKTRSPLGQIPAELSKAQAEASKEVAAVKATQAERAIAWANAKRDDTDTKTLWEAQPITPKIVGVAETQAKFVAQDDGSSLFEGNAGKNPVFNLHIPATDKPVTGFEIEFLSHPSFGKPRRLAPSSNGNFVITDLSVFIGDTPVKIARVEVSHEQKKYEKRHLTDSNKGSGWGVGVENHEGRSEYLRFIPDAPIPVGELKVSLLHRSGFANHHPGRLRLSTTSTDEPDIGNPDDLAADLAAAIEATDTDRTPKQKKAISAHFAKIDPKLLKAEKALSQVEEKLTASGFGIVPVMVMQEAKTIRPTYLLNRGSYEDPDKSEELPRLLPAAIFPEGAEMPTNRLELAQWIVSKQNPLTARVIVNRVWQQHFGVGLVKTVEDFGIQGEPPSHPDLLDWLAASFVESGWDMKALHRLILTSATYRQSSRTTPEMESSDPENRLVARGPRFRMDGFSIRDLALQSAGLLNTRAGGPPVKPYQPPGLWNAVNQNAGFRYKPDSGEGLYRKSLYTYWKRAVNPPRQIIFDAGGREACNVKKKVTNTPLQALVLMNDPTFLEAARHLAARAAKAQPEDEARLHWMVSEVLSRDFDAEGIAILKDNLGYFRSRFTADPESAAEFLNQGTSPIGDGLVPSEHAAWAAVAHLLLNLDEAITLQ